MTGAVTTPTHFQPERDYPHHHIILVSRMQLTSAPWDILRLSLSVVEFFVVGVLSDEVASRTLAADGRLIYLLRMYT